MQVLKQKEVLLLGCTLWIMENQFIQYLNAHLIIINIMTSTTALTDIGFMKFGDFFILVCSSFSKFLDLPILMWIFALFCKGVLSFTSFRMSYY